MSDRILILKELRDRVAKATGSDRELDAAIMAALFDATREKNYWGWQSSRPQGAPKRPASDYWRTKAPALTASLDAAVTLAADGDWGVSWAVESVFAKDFPGNVAVVAYVWRDHPTKEATYCRSPGCIDFKEAAKHLPRLICLARLDYEIATAEATEKAAG